MLDVMNQNMNSLALVRGGRPLVRLLEYRFLFHCVLLALGWRGKLTRLSIRVDRSIFMNVRCDVLFWRRVDNHLELRGHVSRNGYTHATNGVCNAF